MTKSKKLRKVSKRRRTSLDIEEEQSRTLYIRIPHTIKDAEEIKALFFGDLTVRIPRQSARHCHVIFPSIEEKIKNMKLIKKKLIDGKPIFAGPPRPINLEKKQKPKQKKIVIPEPKDDPNIGKYLLVSNIPLGVKGQEIKDAFPGSVTVALLKIHKGSRQAKVKMSSSQLCLNYLKNKSEWPTLRDKKVEVSLSKSANKKRKRNKKSTIKILDGENEKDVSKSNTSDKKQLKKSESTKLAKKEDIKNKEDEDEDEDEEDDDEDDESEEMDDENEDDDDDSEEEDDEEED